MKEPSLQLSVQYAVAPRGVPTRAQFRRWVLRALERDARITIRLVGEAEGKALNATYRKRHYATNVLTFVFRDRAPFEGDLAICVPVVRREARAQGKDMKAHFAHLTIHGVLHLQGYDHENDADAQRMEGREAEIVTRFGYPHPYAAPAARRVRARIQHV